MTIDITGRDQWQAWQDGVLPGVERVRDGVWSIPVPIPDNPLRSCAGAGAATVSR
jgi:hypothetical protein